MEDGAPSREPVASRRADVLAVVVTYNPASGQGLAEHLRALRAQCDVVVVDNGSANAQWVASCARAAQCGVLLNATNEGIAAALNQAARLALAEGRTWLATFDQDSDVPAGAIDRLLALCAGHPAGERIAVATVAHRDRVLGRDYHHAADVIAEHAGWRQLRTTITSGSMVRLAVLQQLGLFEERLFIDAVDHELCLRVRRAGWLVVEEPRVAMLHSIGSATVHRLFGRTVVCTNHAPARLYYRTRNQLEISRRQLGFDPLWSLKGVGQLATTALRIALFEEARGAKLRAMVRGAADFARRRFGPLS